MQKLSEALLLSDLINVGPAACLFRPVAVFPDVMHDIANGKQI